MNEILAICSTSNSGNTNGIDAACRDCDTQVWLSDSTMKSIRLSFPGVDLEKHPPIVLCLICGMKRMKDNNDITLIPPTEEQIKEIFK